MPTIEFHERILSRNSTVLLHLLTDPSPECNDWIITITYYSSLHLIELAADRVDANNGQLRSHADRLEFLEGIEKRAKYVFHKLYILSESVRYGTTFDSEMFVAVMSDLSRTQDVRRTVHDWYSAIESALTK